MSRCLRVGGLNISVHAGTGPLYRAIGRAIGVDLGTTETRQEYNRKNLEPLPKIKLNNSGHATEAENNNIMSIGDVVIQWCYGCHIAPHVLLFAGFDSSGIARYYAKNNSLNNARYNLSSNSQHRKANCIVGGKIIQLSNRSVSVLFPAATLPPVTTTQPPVLITRLPIITTQPPTTTIQPPATTTQPPAPTFKDQECRINFNRPTRNLLRGSSGEDVRWLQTALNRADNAGLAVDGSFGPLTETAVRNFQRRQGLSVDGIVGPITRGKLVELLR